MRNGCLGNGSVERTAEITTVLIPVVPQVPHLPQTLEMPQIPHVTQEVQQSRPPPQLLQASKAAKRLYESDDEDDRLIKKAFTCIDRAVESRLREAKEADKYSIFGQYIACELREISDPDLERWAKQQIVATLCQAQERSLPASSNDI